MTRFSVMWTHSVQIYANVLWGEDKRNSSWLTMLSTIIAYLTRWCDVIFQPLEEKKRRTRRRIWWGMRKEKASDLFLGKRTRFVCECPLFPFLIKYPNIKFTGFSLHLAFSPCISSISFSSFHLLRLPHLSSSRLLSPLFHPSSTPFPPLPLP